MILLLIPLAFLLWKRSRALSWWNPASWWKDSTRLAGGALDALKSWVLGVVRNAIDLVEKDISDAIGYAANLIGATLNNLSHDIGSIGQFLDNVYQWVQGALAAAGNYAAQLVNDLRSWVEAALNAVQGWVQSLLGDLRRWAEAAIGAVGHVAHVWISDVIHLAETLYNQAVGLADAALKAALKWVVALVEQAWNSVYKAVKHDFIDPIEVVLNVVRKAWDWIYWFAEHPFQVMHNAETDVISWAEHLPQDVAHIVEGESFLRGLDAAGKYLGG